MILHRMRHSLGPLWFVSWTTAIHSFSLKYHSGWVIGINYYYYYYFSPGQFVLKLGKFLDKILVMGVLTADRLRQILPRYMKKWQSSRRVSHFPFLCCLFFYLHWKISCCFVVADGATHFIIGVYDVTSCLWESLEHSSSRPDVLYVEHTSHLRAGVFSVTAQPYINTIGAKKKKKKVLSPSGKANYLF